MHGWLPCIISKKGTMLVEPFTNDFSFCIGIGVKNGSVVLDVRKETSILHERQNDARRGASTET